MRFHFCLEHKSETKVGTDSPKQDSKRLRNKIMCFQFCFVFFVLFSFYFSHNHVTEITFSLNLMFSVKIFCKIRYVSDKVCLYALLSTVYTLKRLITWLNLIFFCDSPVQIISQSPFNSVYKGLMTSTDNLMNLLPTRPPLSLYFVCKSLQLFAFFFCHENSSFHEL